MSKHLTTWQPGASSYVTVLGLAFVLAVGFAAPAPMLADSVYSSGLFQLGDMEPPPGMPGTAEILQDPALVGPDWASLFNADGTARDDHPFDEQGNPVGNGIPDYLELHGGQWAVFTADDVSMGSGFEGTALHPDGRVYNSTVATEHDLGHAFVYSTVDSLGNVVLYAGAQRLGGGDSSIEFEFNQDHFRLGHGGYGVGAPWQVLGSRAGGDVLIKLTFASGFLASVEASTWNGQSWVLLSAVGGEGCDGAETLCALCNGAAIDGGPWDPQQVEAGRFSEVGINIGALLGAQPMFTTVRLRTPQDTAFGYFAEGN